MFCSLRARFILGSAVLAGTLTWSAWAADNHWTNAGGTGSVMDAGNWSLNHLPAFGENALFDSGTQVVMQPNHFLTADSIESWVPLYMNGGVITCASLTTHTTFSTYNNATIHAINAINIDGTWNMFDVDVTRWGAIGSLLYIAPGAQVALWDGIKQIEVDVRNEGLVEGQNQAITFGSNLSTLEFQNMATGVVVDTSFTANNNSGYLPPPRLQRWEIFVHRWYAACGRRVRPARRAGPGRRATNDRPAAGPGRQCLPGQWRLDAAQRARGVSHQGGDVQQIGPNSDCASGERRQLLRRVAGRPEHSGTARAEETPRCNLALRPWALSSWPTMASCEWRKVRASKYSADFKIGGPNAVFDKIVTQPGANDVIVTSASSHVDGQLIVEIQNPNLVPRGTSIGLLRDSGECCTIDGNFASVLVFGTNAPTSVDLSAA